MGNSQHLGDDMMKTDTSCWQNLMDNAYDKWGISKKTGKSWGYRQFLNNLDAVERKAVVLGNFHYQTCNGGIQQYIDNGYATGSGKDLLTILDEMDTESSRRVKRIVEGAFQHVDFDGENRGFGENYWNEDWVDDEPPACYDEVDKLTDEYYEFYDDFVKDVEAFLVG
jgi:hypothetical protein